MRVSKFDRLAVGIILSAYLVAGALSPKNLLDEALFFKTDKALSGQADRSIIFDELPFWTSHKHLTSSEQFSKHCILDAAEPWISVLSSERFGEIAAVFFPTPARSFSPTALRAPPRS
ncbi:MAG TPA: hypothetical protein VMM58_04955 [Bacteroidota bacterium]|nr:hypothetical protein [Bacteroidota bacterium]